MYVHTNILVRVEIFSFIFYSNAPTLGRGIVNGPAIQTLISEGVVRDMWNGPHWRVPGSNLTLILHLTDKIRGLYRDSLLAETKAKCEAELSRRMR